MKITVLGCWGAYPEPGEATAGYLLQTDKHNILLDCGSGVLSGLLCYLGIEDLDAVFISHFHNDHCTDVGCLQYATKFSMLFNKRLNPLAIYANNKSDSFINMTYKKYTVGKEITADKEIEINGLKISFKPTIHDVYNLAMRFEYEGKVLVYTGDMGPKTDLNSFCSQADLLICETSLFEEEGNMFPGHMTTKETALLAKNAQVKNLMLTHFPHAGDIGKMPSEVLKYYNGGVFLAKMGYEHII
ncbi:MAG: MBL fold metallo-hydrolase [Eubacteriales bacterium]